MTGIQTEDRMARGCQITTDYEGALRKRMVFKPKVINDLRPGAEVLVGTTIEVVYDGLIEEGEYAGQSRWRLSSATTGTAYKLYWLWFPDEDLETIA